MHEQCQLVKMLVLTKNTFSSMIAMRTQHQALLEAVLKLKSGAVHFQRNMIEMGCLDYRITKNHASHEGPLARCSFFPLGKNAPACQPETGWATAKNTWTIDLVVGFDKLPLNISG